MWTTKNTIQEDDSSDEDDDKEQDQAEEMPEEDPKEKEDDVLGKVSAENRVILAKENMDNKDGPWCVIRPSDQKSAVLKISDPVIQALQVQDQWQLVVDSQSQEAGSKPKFVDKLLLDRKATDVTNLTLLDLCQQYLPHLSQVHFICCIFVQFHMHLN